MQQPSEACVLYMTQAAPSPVSSHYIYTVNTRTQTPDSRIRWWWVYVRVFVYTHACIVFALYVNIQDFLESVSDTYVFVRA